MAAVSLLRQYQRNLGTTPSLEKNAFNRIIPIGFSEEFGPTCSGKGSVLGENNDKVTKDVLEDTE